MQSNGQRTTSETLALPRTKSRLIREWLALFGENYQREISPVLANIWEKHLDGVPEDDLKTAFERVLRTSRFFPCVADVRACLEKPQQELDAVEEGKDLLDAERAWESLQAHIREWGAEETPTFSNGRFIHPPELPGEVEYAVRQCGGYPYVATADASKVVFIRRDFIQHFRRHRETKGLLAPSRQEARALLNQVQTWKGQLGKGDRG